MPKVVKVEIEKEYKHPELLEGARVSTRMKRTAIVGAWQESPRLKWHQQCIRSKMAGAGGSLADIQEEFKRVTEECKKSNPYPPSEKYLKRLKRKVELGDATETEKELYKFWETKIKEFKK